MQRCRHDFCHKPQTNSLKKFKILIAIDTSPGFEEILENKNPEVIVREIFKRSARSIPNEIITRIPQEIPEGYLHILLEEFLEHISKEVPKKTQKRKSQKI